MKYTPARYSDFANAPCCALVNGKRCGRRWKQANPVTWVWEPTTGRGTDGPYVVLCGIHRRAYERSKDKAARARDLAPRLRVVGGWFGPYNEHNYGSAVWADPVTWRVAERWWRHRRSGALFGVQRRDAL